jgi:hypothetical protein
MPKALREILSGKDQITILVNEKEKTIYLLPPLPEQLYDRIAEEDMWIPIFIPGTREDLMDALRNFPDYAIKVVERVDFFLLLEKWGL